MTDEPFDVEALRAEIVEEMHRTEYVGEKHQLAWVLSLLPHPPPKYEVTQHPGAWSVIRRTAPAVGLTVAWWDSNGVPDAEQRAREECARLNEAARNE